MHIHLFKLFFLSIFSIFLLVGCSDIEHISASVNGNTTDTNTTDTNTTSNTITGQFLDAYVQDMNYTCSSGTSGVTDAVGSFTCNVGDDITFFLGDNNVSTVTAELIITPYTLFPTSLDSAINLTRLLQSLDDDSNLTNSVISIDKTLEVMLPSDLNFSSPTFEDDVEADLNITLVNANEAQTRLNDFIVAEGGTVAIDTIAPLADAGSDAIATTNDLVILDGNSSVASTYAWSFVSKPVGSTATLTDSTTFAPTFTADLNGTYEIELTVNAADINFDTDRVIITVTDVVIPPVPVNNAPDINVSTLITVAENQTSAMTISATDDDNDTLTYSVLGTDSASFSVNQTSGVVTFISASNYEIKNSYEITAKVSDSTDSDEQNVTINILNVLEIPVLLAGTFSIAENSAAVSALGAVTILTHGDDTITTFTLSGTGSENFSINSSGALSTATSFDYESNTQYILQVTATNSVGTSASVDITINITDVEDIAPTLVDTSLTFREDAVVGDVIGSITIDDAGDSPISGISISGTGSGNFEFSTSGVLSVKAGAVIDYETTNEYNLTAQATNLTGPSNSVNLHLQVNNVIDEVATIAASTGSVDENASVGTSVGTLSITDIGDSNITSIELTGTGSTYFSITNSGAVTLSTADVLDFESEPSYILDAVATNTAGVSNTATFTITIGNIAEIPILENTSLSIMENEIASAVVGTILIDDTSVDSGDSPITDITLSGAGATNFESGVDGVVTLSATSDIDFETTPTYTLGAVATNTAGASVSVVVTISIEDYAFDPTQIARINASDAELDDRFGSSLDISGDYMIVGAPNEDAGALSDGGSAYLYKKDNLGVVTQLTKLTASVPKTEELFGSSVAIDGNVTVIGAPEGASASGDVYIYLVDANDSVTLPPQQIDLGGAAANGDSFGSAVAISGDYIVVGAPNKASAYLYELDANQTASLVDTITEVGLIAGDNYASSIAIDGNYIVIGAKDKFISSNSNGMVYFYEINPATDTASLLGTQNLSGVVDYDYFGSSVGVSGDYAVVGAYGIDTVATNAGYAYLYKINAGVVSKMDEFAPNLAPDSLSSGDYFGYSIDIDGEYIVSGAYQKDSGATTNAGSAYVYHIDITDDTASLVKKLDLASQVVDDYFGATVAIDGDFMIVGTPNEDSNATNGGAVYLFDGEPIP